MLTTIIKLSVMQLKRYSFYKSNFFLFTFNKVIEVIVYIFIWQAIYKSTGTAGGFTLAEMVTYYVLSTTFGSLVLWGVVSDMAHAIRNGQINRELLNPISYFKYYFGLNLGELIYASMLGLAVFVICSIFWQLLLPVSFLDFFLCLMLILLGIPITFFLQMIIGTLGFYTNSIWGLQILRIAIIQVFSGIIAPITLFPLWFQKISEFLPFKDLIYTPVNIWLGNISINETIYVIIKQIIWGIILYFIAMKFFKFAVKKITINGG